MPTDTSLEQLPRRVRAQPEEAVPV